MINLFPDQAELVGGLKKSLSRNKTVILQAATGAGKTIMTSHMISGIQKAGKTAMFVAPRRELIRQVDKTFMKYGITNSHIVAGYQYRPMHSVYLACTDTLINRIRSGSDFDSKFVFLDESHYGGKKNDDVITYFQNKGSYVIPMTATPNEQIIRHADDMVCGPSIKWLIQNKRLSDYRPFRASRPDFSKMKRVAGEYHRGEMAERMEGDRAIIGDAVKYYNQDARGRKMLAFCYSVDHSKITAQVFCDAGIPAAHIDAKTPDNERIRIIREFAYGRVRVLCSVDLCIFGFDLASQVDMDVVVDGMFDMAPTLSENKQLQKWGRVLRYKPEPALIYDHSNNISEHGLPDEDRDWSMDIEDSGVRGDSERTIPTRTCPKCYFCHPPKPVCPECSHVYDTSPRKIAEVDGVLEEFDKEQLRVKIEEEKAARERKKKVRENKVQRNKNLSGDERKDARAKRKAWLESTGKSAYVVNKILKNEGLL